MLTDGQAGRCEIEHRTAIAAETTRRLCCDAGIVLVVDGTKGEPLSVGRRTRCIPYDNVPMFAMAWWDSGDAPPKTGSAAGICEEGVRDGSQVRSITRLIGEGGIDSTS